MWYFRGFDPLFGPSNDYGNVIFCYSDKHVELRIKSKDWFVILRFGNHSVMNPKDVFVYGSRVRHIVCIFCNINDPFSVDLFMNYSA